MTHTHTQTIQTGAAMAENRSLCGDCWSGMLQQYSPSTCSFFVLAGSLKNYPKSSPTLFHPRKVYRLWITTAIYARESEDRGHRGVLRRRQRDCHRSFAFQHTLSSICRPRQYTHAHLYQFPVAMKAPEWIDFKLGRCSPPDGLLHGTAPPYLADERHRSADPILYSVFAVPRSCL